VHHQLERLRALRRGRRRHHKEREKTYWSDVHWTVNEHQPRGPLMQQPVDGSTTTTVDVRSNSFLVMSYIDYLRWSRASTFLPSYILFPSAIVLGD
jgi:hypothetical protein